MALSNLELETEVRRMVATESAADPTLLDRLVTVVRDLIAEIHELRAARDAYRSTERQAQQATDQIFADLIKQARAVLEDDRVPSPNGPNYPPGYAEKPR